MVTKSKIEVVPPLERRTIELTDDQCDPPIKYTVTVGNENPGYVGIYTERMDDVLVIRGGFVPHICNALREAAAKAGRYETMPAPRKQ